MEENLPRYTDKKNAAIQMPSGTSLSKFISTNLRKERPLFSYDHGNMKHAQWIDKSRFFMNTAEKRHVFLEALKSNEVLMENISLRSHF